MPQKHAEYLYQCIEETIPPRFARRDRVLTVFDAVLRAVINIVDMPNQRASLLIRLILQIRASSLRANEIPFPRYRDDEIDRIEKAVWGTWQDAHHTEISENS